MTRATSSLLSSGLPWSQARSGLRSTNDRIQAVRSSDRASVRARSITAWIIDRPTPVPATGEASTTAARLDNGCVRMARLNADGGLEFGDSFRQTAGNLRQRGTQIVVRVGEIRIGGERGAELGEGVRQPAGDLSQRRSQIDVRLGQARFDGKRRFVLGDRIG